MTTAERDRLKLELRVGRLIGRSVVGKLRPLAGDGGEQIVGGEADLIRRLQAMPDDGYSYFYDEHGGVISRTRIARR